MFEDPSLSQKMLANPDVIAGYSIETIRGLIQIVSPTGSELQKAVLLSQKIVDAINENQKDDGKMVNNGMVMASLLMALASISQQADVRIKEVIKKEAQSTETAQKTPFKIIRGGDMRV